MRQEPLAVWTEEVPVASQIGLHLVALTATRNAHAMCTAAFPGYNPLSYIVGWNRFTALQHGLMEFGKTDAVFKSTALAHANGLPFTQLRTPRIHLTTAVVDSENAHPQMSLFREQEQERQLAFLNGDGILICHLAVLVGNDLSVPSVVRVHFPDGVGGYLSPHVDLKAMHATPIILPVETVKDNRTTPTISRKGQQAASRDLAW